MSRNYLFVFFILFGSTTSIDVKALSHSQDTKNTNNCSGIENMPLEINLWGSWDLSTAKNQFLAEHKNEKQILALESLIDSQNKTSDKIDFNEPKPHSNVFGLDDELPLVFSNLIELMNSNNSTKYIEKIYNSATIIKFIRNEAKLNELWLRFQKNFSEKEKLELNNALLALEKISAVPTPENTLLPLLNNEENKSIRRLSIFIKNLLNKFIFFAGDAILLSPDIINYNLKVGDEYHKALGDFAIREESADYLLKIFSINFRNKIMVDKIYQLLCNEVRSGEIHFNSLVNWNRLPALADLIKEKLPKTKVNIYPLYPAHFKIPTKNFKNYFNANELEKNNFSHSSMSDEELLLKIKNANETEWKSLLFFIARSRAKALQNYLKEIIDDPSASNLNKKRIIELIPYLENPLDFADSLKIQDRELKLAIINTFTGHDLDNNSAIADRYISKLSNNNIEKEVLLSSVRILVEADTLDVKKKVFDLLRKTQNPKLVYAFLHEISQRRDPYYLEAVEHVHEKILGSKLPSYANFASDTDTASNKTYDLIQEINNCMSLLKDTYDPVLNTPALKMFLNNLEIDQIKGALKLVP